MKSVEELRKMLEPPYCTYLRGTKCTLCGESVETDETDHWGIDECDICGKQYCESCMVSFSPTMCKKCAGLLAHHTDDEKRDMCNAGVGRRPPKERASAIPRGRGLWGLLFGGRDA